MVDYDVLVIGLGPAGMTSLIYLQRSNLKCAVIEKGMPGGLLNKSSVIENYPGFTKISGPELMEKFYDGVKDVPFINEEVIDIDFDGDIKIVKTTENEYRCKGLILAIGRRPKTLENTRSLVGKGVSFCSLCDGYLYKNEDVAIVGSGNSAIEEALYLADICKKVYILCKRDKLSSDFSLVERVKSCDNIEVIYNSNIDKFNSISDKLDSIDVSTLDGVLNLKIKACFIFIGYEPCSNFLKKLDILDDLGYINVDTSFRTSIPLVYACGDIVKKDAYQIVIACSDGARAAISCIKDLGK